MTRYRRCFRHDRACRSAFGNRSNGRIDQSRACRIGTGQSECPGHFRGHAAETPTVSLRRKPVSRLKAGWSGGVLTSREKTTRLPSGLHDGAWNGPVIPRPRLAASARLRRGGPDGPRRTRASRFPEQQVVVRTFAHNASFAASIYCVGIDGAKRIGGLPATCLMGKANPIALRSLLPTELLMDVLSPMFEVRRCRV